MTLFVLVIYPLQLMYDFFFFFKQKTAYEIEWCWSSDVCSSDLPWIRWSGNYRATCLDRNSLAAPPRWHEWLWGEGCLTSKAQPAHLAIGLKRKARPQTDKVQLC